MRKPTNSGSGKGKPFKGKEGGKSFGKSGGSKPYSDRTKGDREGSTERRPKRDSDNEKPRRSFGGDSDKSSFRSNTRSEGAPRGERSFSGRAKPYSDDKPKRSFDKSDDRPAFKRRTSDDRTAGSERPYAERKPKPRGSSDDTDRKPAFKRKAGGEPSLGEDVYSGRRSKRSFEDSPRTTEGTAERSGFRSREPRDAEKPFRGERKTGRTSDGPERRKTSGAGFDANARKYGPAKFTDESLPQRKVRKKESDDEAIKRVKFGDFEDGKVFSNANRDRDSKGSKPKTKFKKATTKSSPQSGDGLTRLNKYLSNAGIASRRDADTLIQSGVVKVNGVVVDQLGYKISASDKVTYGDAPVRGERKVYLLLNKPKDYITTVDDPQERKTVMELVSKACKERIYPVGRLDRNTTGLLLFTNDGEMTTRLTHPKFGVRKVYHVSLNKGLKPDDFKLITEGLELEDGIVKADDLAFVGEGKKEIGIEIHSGRNRIVRRIFEHLGYDVLKLDRVVFAGLTKKDLPRGKHRFLTAKEIGFLQMIG